MIERLVKLLALVVFAGPLVAAYVTAPVEVLDAWPVWTLTLVPAVFVLVAGTVFRAYRPFVDAPLPDSAGVWLKKTLDRQGVLGISVAAVDRAERGHGNYFHPASKTIVLDDNVHGEHTARAYATAAHELGHALFHNDRPWVSRVLLAARGNSGRLYFQGVGLLFGVAITGATSLRVIAFALVALAVVLHALVLVDEAIASAMARDFLRDDLGEADQGRIARRHLQGALATYAALLVAYVVPLAVAPWVLDGSAGVIAPGPPLAGATATFADIGAWITVVGAVAALVAAIRPFRNFVDLVLCGLLGLLAYCWNPFVATLLADQAAVPRWTVALATVPAWSMLVAPLLHVVRWFASKLAPDVDMMPMPERTLERVSRRKLAEAEPDSSVWTRLVAFSSILWIVPLAYSWL